MFIQVISGKVKDADAMQRHADKWQTDLRPGATGFLGVTQGITDDNRFVVLARFESPEAARKNSERPEQGKWFEEMQQYIDDVTIHDSSRVETLFGGGQTDQGLGIPGLNSAPQIPFIELGGGGGGLLSKLLGGGVF